MLLCIYSGKLLNVTFKTLLFCSRLQVIHVSSFLHLGLIPFLTHSFNYRAMFSLRNEGDEKSVLVS